MMRTMFDDHHAAGYRRASLAVQKANPALHLYERMGFRIVGDGFDKSEWLMVYRPDQRVGLEFRRLSIGDVRILCTHVV